MLKLYHYSNTDFKGYIRPDFFGLNSYTKNSAKESGVKRSFFYIGRGREYFFQGVKFCYITEIDPAKVYDIDKDKKKLVKKLVFGQDIFEVIKKVD
jgi:hypothetical protein